jgi:hypothetical protein
MFYKTFQNQHYYAYFENSIYKIVNNNYIDLNSLIFYAFNN